MQDSAVISRNTSSTNGGGVYVNYSGTFTMHDSAVIQGNTASNYGGGVYVSSGTFRKEPRTEGSTSGIIYGSDESGVDQDGYDLKNTATYGSAIYVDSSKQKDTTVWETTSLSTDSSENWE
jgi:putative cofactor-binding repeat protein